MSTLEMILWIVLALVGVLGSAMCSGLEVGLYTVNRVLVRVRSADENLGRGAKTLDQLIRYQSQTLTSLLIWNNMFNYVGTLAITSMIATVGLSDTGMILVQVVALTPVLLIFAESTPKELFRSNANVLMERFSFVAQIMKVIVTWIPLVPLVLVVARLATKVAGLESFDAIRSSRQHMSELLKFGSLQMSEAQVSLIDRALELEHAKVRNEMVPMKNAITLRDDWSIQKAKMVIRTSSYTRFPVVSSKGGVVGVLAGLDLYLAEHQGADQHQKIESLLESPVRVSIDSSVRTALTKMSRASAKMGIVTNDGKDVGIVTRKNLVEPLTGELEAW